MENNRRIISVDEIAALMKEYPDNGFSYENLDDYSRRFQYLMKGDIRAVDEADRLMRPESEGRFSNDALRNMKYMFIVNTGLATRYMIEAGIPQETVFSVSDTYIKKADVARTEKEVHEINRAVWSEFVDIVKSFKKVNVYSQTVLTCINFLDSHFNEKVTLDSVAESLGLTSAYLATIFKRETGKTFLGYLTERRIEVSKALLAKTNYSFNDIANSLSFCSQSHFSKMFKKHTGYTPKEYRVKYYAATFSKL